MHGVEREMVVHTGDFIVPNKSVSLKISKSLGIGLGVGGVRVWVFAFRFPRRVRAGPAGGKGSAVGILVTESSGSRTKAWMG